MTSYYEDKAGVDSYIEMAEGYDGRALIGELHSYLPDGASVLELGMGPGKDLDILSEHYVVTGSDYSAEFLARYRQQHPNADLLKLDAATLDTDRTFDCIYSNKVLQHLSRDQLRQSLTQQAELLNVGGLICHSFWRGDEEMEHGGLVNVYYTKAQLRKLIDSLYEILVLHSYTEMDTDDSLLLIARKR